jgi:hypothetical protein
MLEYTYHDQRTLVFDSSLQLRPNLENPSPLAGEPPVPGILIDDVAIL